MSGWLLGYVNRVPSITGEQIAEMRHILPVMQAETPGMYQLIAGSDKLDPCETSFLRGAKPQGPEFTYHVLNQVEVITQHHSSIFFKPSLAEVYAWIRFYMGDNWRQVKHFYLHDPHRVGSTTDIACQCLLFGGEQLVRGEETPPGSGCYTLVPAVGITEE